jgi:RNA polymerase sigma-70 factor (ECF subfamily)
MNAEQQVDLALLERIRAGDEAALADLYDRYTPLLYPVALRILRHGPDAEDAVQDAWMQVWKRSATYDPRRGAVVAWLLTVVRTRALDRWRSLAARARAESAVDPEPLNAPPDPSHDSVVAQLARRVREALAQLGAPQRQVLEIAYFEGLSQSEIAERVGAPLGTVKSWTRQGLQKLKELLPQEEWV